MSDLGPIFDPTRSVVLVASAGTGKTWRLVRRYLRIVAGHPAGTDEPWARPDQVVAVTFTRAAAAEMRARVFAALTAGADEATAQIDPDDDPVLAAIYEQRSLAWRLALAEQVAPAPIGTLHSLCARMLAEFPELSGVPPDARPLERAEQSLELDEFVSVWIEQVLDRPAHRAHALCVELLAAHPLAFIRRELRAMVDDRDWTLDRMARAPTLVSDGDPVQGAVASGDWRQAEAVLAARESFVRDQWRQYVHYLQQPLAWVLQACAMSLAQGHVNERLSALRQATAAMLRHVPEPNLDTIWADRAALLDQRPHAKLGTASAAALHTLRNNERVLSTRRRRPVMPNPGPSLSRAQAEHVARWVTLASMAREDWLAKLRQRAVLRYDDLELLAYELLDKPEAQAQLRGRYRHVLVDEYQDVNQIQAEIVDRLAMLCGEPGAPAKVFLIGDPKQSIYRFRGADPRVFLRAEVVYAGPEADPELAGELVRLVDNRRSSPTLIRFFAHLFPPLFAGVLPWANITELGRPAELAGLRDVLDHAPVPWDGDIVGVRARDRFPGLGVDLLLRHQGEPSDDEDLAAEATRVAAHVRGMLAGATLGRDATPARAREVAILVPRWHLAEDYRAALEREGIIADLAGGRGLLLLPEVRDLINLVRLWADPQDELAALAVLRGPCFAISDLGLYALARWPGIDRRVREADPDLPEFAELDELWEVWDREDPSEDEAPEEGNDQPRWPRRHPRRIRELLRHGRLDPARVVAALEAAELLTPAEGESAADARARITEQLGADAAALEHGRDRFLARMRDAGSRSTADLLGDLIVEFQLEAHWLESARGRRAVANAWRFVEHARSLEPEGPDLQRLGAWLDAGAEPAPEGLIAPDADAVTITTWHGAKGKEWPIVVVAGVGEFRTSGSRTSWSGARIPTLDPRPGPGDEAVPVPRIRQPHVGFVAANDPLHESCTNMLTPLEAAESKRLIYVAMTRARDRLVISGEADKRAHIYFDDKPWLGLDKRFDMTPLLGEPKPAFLCRRPIELVIAGLDLPAAPRGVGVIRPRAATWSLAHTRVVDDAMLRAGRERPLPVSAVEPEPEPTPPRPPKPEPKPKPANKPSKGRPARGRKRKPKPGQAAQLGFAGFFDGPAPEPPPAPEPEPAVESEQLSTSIWLAGPALKIWTPSGGRSPWPVSELEWDMPLPARRPVLLDEEDPRLLGELFHCAMELWDFVGDPPRSAAIDPLVASLFPGRMAREQRPLARWAARCCELVTADEALFAELCAARARDELFHEVDIDALIADETRDHRIRGRIDLLWRGADGRWNVLDYKVTSKLRSRAQMEELQWEYGPQLVLYRQALAGWRRGGELQPLGRMGLWLAPGGRAMWLMTQ